MNDNVTCQGVDRTCGFYPSDAGSGSGSGPIASIFDKSGFKIAHSSKGFSGYGLGGGSGASTVTPESGISGPSDSKALASSKSGSGSGSGSSGLNIKVAELAAGAVIAGAIVAAVNAGSTQSNPQGSPSHRPPSWQELENRFQSAGDQFC